MSADRDLDVVLFGATGFVGRLTAEYLARSAPEEARIGLAARSREKLAKVRDELGPRAADWPLIEADSNDNASLEALAAATKVVCTTVGPYAQYGMPLVEACAAAGTHYADLAGETLFVRDSIDRFHKPAGSTGARIVHSCGFDSIPSDISVHLLHEAAGELTETTLVVTALKGGMSGGTLASGQGQFQEMRANPARAKIAEDPYALTPDRTNEPDLGESDLRFVEHSSELRRWLGPFIMAPFNTRLVRRSNALRDHAYGKRFRYREVMGFPDGVIGCALATAMAGGLGAVTGAMNFGPTKKVLDRFLPAPGEGPSERLRDSGFFKLETHAHMPSGERYICRVAAQGDPGYKATAVMLGESALCLALDRDKLPDAAGVLTPATAMGTPLADRLRAAGHTYDVERIGGPKATPRQAAAGRG